VHIWNVSSSGGPWTIRKFVAKKAARLNADYLHEDFHVMVRMT